MNSQILSFFRLGSRAASRIVLAIGLLVGIGWLFDIAALKNILPGTAAMKANTALAFVLSGGSLGQATLAIQIRRYLVLSIFLAFFGCHAYCLCLLRFMHGLITCAS